MCIFVKLVAFCLCKLLMVEFSIFFHVYAFAYSYVYIYVYAYLVIFTI